VGWLAGPAEYSNMSLFSSKSKSSQSISRDRALSDPEAQSPAQTPAAPTTATTHHTFQVTSKDNVPAHPKPELPGN
jgi:hypothetical protein